MKKDNEWNGPQDGLPPVGTKCDILYKKNGSSFCRNAVITYWGNNIFCYKSTFNGVEQSATPDKCIFRPIQLELDKIVEKAMEHVLFDCTYAEASILAGFARNLHKAGMLVDPERKPMSRYAAGQLLSEEFGLNSTVYFDSINLVLDTLGYKE